jgi:transcriptional regulator with XRE-family HTH domain
MELRHPIDDEIRARLKALGPNQTAFAKLIGRQQSWLNKYMNGAGHATVDDVIRIAAALIGVAPAALTEPETRLLKAFRALADDDRREDAIVWLSAVARKNRPQPHQESGAQQPHTPPAGARTKHGKR